MMETINLDHILCHFGFEDFLLQQNYQNDVFPEENIDQIEEASIDSQLIILLDVIVHCFLLVQIQIDNSVFDEGPALGLGGGDALPEGGLLVVDPRDQDDGDTHDDPHQGPGQHIHGVVEIVTHPGQRYPKGKTETLSQKGYFERS